MRIARSAVGGVALAVSLAVSLSACSVHPGTAAVVDGTSISQDELEVATRELAPILPGASSSTILAVLIAAPTYLQAARDNGVGISPDDAKALLAQAAGSAGLSPIPDYGTGALDVALFSLANGKLGKLDGGDKIIAGVQAEVGKLSVTVNPRYGAFDPQTGQVGLTTPDWIVATPAK